MPEQFPRDVDEKVEEGRFTCDTKGNNSNISMQLSLRDDISSINVLASCNVTTKCVLNRVFKSKAIRKERLVCSFSWWGKFVGDSTRNKSQLLDTEMKNYPSSWVQPTPSCQRLLGAMKSYSLWLIRRLY